MLKEGKGNSTSGCDFDWILRVHFPEFVVFCVEKGFSLQLCKGVVGVIFAPSSHFEELTPISRWSIFYLQFCGEVGNRREVL